MNIAFCYEQVMPSRGGCETYIADLSRRLIVDRHEVHLYASRWDASALPPQVIVHPLPPPSGLRFLRPWTFGKRCLEAMKSRHHDVTVGFDKTWGQDVLYPQGGLHAASARANLIKHPPGIQRILAGVVKSLDPAHWSFSLLERKQYLAEPRPQIIVNSFMVRDHFQHFYAVSAQNLHVIRSAIDSGRFPEHDRLKRRQEMREAWNLAPEDIVGLFAGMNYRLKGLDPLLRALLWLNQHPAGRPLKLIVAGSPNVARYEARARSLGVADQVRFVGHCAPMRNGYFAADFLVHPTFYDPCSLVVLEALACGMPIVTTKYNGASEVMNPPSEGLVVSDPHDQRELGDALRRMMDASYRQSCSHAARKAAQSWTFEAHYAQMMSVFRSVLAVKQAA